MTQNLIEVVEAIKKAQSAKNRVANPVFVAASAAIDALKSLGWLPPSEVQAIRAAALEEAAVYMEGDERNTYAGEAFAAAIRALSTTLPEYVVVKRDDISAIEKLLMQASQAKGDAVLTKVTP